MTGEASGTAHVFSRSAAVTSKYNPGEYLWIAYVQQTDGILVRKTIANGRLTVNASVVYAGVATDLRSHAERMLDSIKAALEHSVASNAHVVSLSIDGKSVSYGRAELVKMKNEYEWLVYNEKKAELIAQGLDTGGRILTRFGGTS